MNKQEIIAWLEDRYGLAQIYLEDGAPRRASEILFEMATQVRSFAIDRELGMKELLGKDDQP